MTDRMWIEGDYEVMLGGTRIPHIPQHVFEDVMGGLGRNFSGFVAMEFENTHVNDGSLACLNAELKRPDPSPYFAMGYLVMRVALRATDKSLVDIPPRTVVRFDYVTQRAIENVVIYGYSWWDRPGDKEETSFKRDSVRERRSSRVQDRQGGLANFAQSLENKGFPVDQIQEFLNGATEMYSLAAFKEPDDAGNFAVEVQESRPGFQGRRRLSAREELEELNARQDYSAPSAVALAFANALERQVDAALVDEGDVHTQQKGKRTRARKPRNVLRLVPGKGYRYSTE